MEPLSEITSDSGGQGKHGGSVTLSQINTLKTVCDKLNHQKRLVGQTCLRSSQMQFHQGIPCSEHREVATDPI